MKNAVFAPALLLAGALFAVVPTVGAQGGAGGAQSSSQVSPRDVVLRDFDGSDWGIASVRLRVESGLFVVLRPGRLRSFPRKYLYTVRNADFWGRDELVIDHFEPSTCGLRYLALLPTRVAGEFADPQAWPPTTWSGPGDRSLFWSCTNPFSQGLLPEEALQFELFSDAEPAFAPITLRGSGVDGETLMPIDVQAIFNYVTPGCNPAPPTHTPEFDLELRAEPTQVSPGHFATITIRARNVGSAAATSVTIADPLPAGLVYQPGSLTHNGAPVAAQEANLWSTGLALASIAPGATEEIRFRARVAAGLAEGTLLSQTARLACDQTPTLDSVPAGIRVGPSDRTPPGITIYSPFADTYGQHETIPIQFEAADADPGLVPGETRATLDGQPVSDGASVQPYELPPGPHTLVVTALDYAGNRATRSVTFEVAATIGSTIQQVLNARRAGGIRSDATMGTLNRLLVTARDRLEAGDRTGGLLAIEAFRKAVNSTARRGWRPGAEGNGLIDEPTVALLTASADYLLKNPVP